MKQRIVNLSLTLFTQKGYAAACSKGGIYHPDTLQRSLSNREMNRNAASVLEGIGIQIEEGCVCLLGLGNMSM
jgi:hypothetical protein